MDVYLLLPLIQALFCLVLIAVVLKGHLQSFIHRLFSLFLLSLFVWGVMIFGMRASPDIEHAYLWEKWLVAVAPFTSVLFYHFSVRYATTKIRGWPLPFLYTICFLFIPLAVAGLIVSSMQIKPYGYAPIFGLAGPFNVLFTLAMSLMAFLTFVRAYRISSQAEQKNRAAYIITAMVFSLIGATFDILPVLGLPLYPGLIIGNIIFCLLTTVAIIRHNLLDIRVVMRKGVAYILTSALIALPFVGVFVLVTKVFSEGSLPSWAYFVLAIILALVLPYLWQMVQRCVDRWFYRDRYDYLKALETFSRETQSVTDSAKLSSTMVNLLAKALRSSNVHLLQPLPYGGDYAMVCSSGVEDNNPGLLSSRGALVKWLERSNAILSYDDIEIIPQLQGITAKERETLQRIGTKLIIGLKTPTGRLSGLLILGPKLSEQPYTVEDKELIYTICNQMSTNLENARLYRASRQEVAERKWAVEALKLQKAYFQQLFDNSPEGIALLDTDERVVDINKGFETLFGYRIEEIKGRFINSVVVPEERIEEASALSRAILNNEVIRKETVRKRKDGSLFDVSILGYPIRLDAKIVGVYAIYSDITERKRAEEEEKRLQQELYLSSRLASIGELAAGVAHQINNPLTGILGFSQRLLRKSTDEEARRDLERIHNEAQRAAKVVENLLTFARRREPKKQYASINDIVQKALELRAYELKTGNIEVTTELTPNLPQAVVDFHQIQEVFLNIILNAEQAVTEANHGGKLAIKTEDKKGYIRISFTDDGPGIARENLNRIFDPFFSTRGERGGTGLGLSVCHGIVTEHSGKIYAKSKPGKGATFFVELPVIAEK